MKISGSKRKRSLKCSACERCRRRLRIVLPLLIRSGPRKPTRKLRFRTSRLRRRRGNDTKPSSKSFTSHAKLNSQIMMRGSKKSRDKIVSNS